MRFKNILVVYAQARNKEQRETLALVRKTLRSCSIENVFVNRDKLKRKDFTNKDLVITVGGDGTLLVASHFIFDTTPIFGVNSDTSKKEGFLLDSSKKNFVQKFKKLTAGEVIVEKLQRLQAKIAGKKTKELALNEFYVASRVAYYTARYFLSIGKKIEKQRSSGVLISTATGSHAWMKSAGGKRLPLNSKKIQYFVREPYFGKTAPKLQLRKGVLSSKAKIGVEFFMGSGLLVADSIGKEYVVKKGEKVTIVLSNKPLHILSCK